MQRRKKWIITLLPLLALSALALLFWPDPPTYVPENVWGIWKTTDPRYADRYLDISEVVFAIGQGQQRMQVFFIRRVDRQPIGPHERFTLFFRPDQHATNALQTLTFDFYPTDEVPRIELKHPKGIIWCRESERSPAYLNWKTAMP